MTNIGIAARDADGQAALAQDVKASCCHRLPMKRPVEIQSILGRRCFTGIGGDNDGSGASAGSLERRPHSPCEFNVVDGVSLYGGWDATMD
jgi:hypothetical protein